MPGLRAKEDPLAMGQIQKYHIMMDNNTIDIKEPLHICLCKFNGAEESDGISREDSLLIPFMTLAKKLIYGGYIRVRDEYAIFINTVEFYYHEEYGAIKDHIVYHRNGMFLLQGKDSEPRSFEVPYFPIMTFNSHMSGIDITFENSAKQYRASALIREYVVYDIKAKSFIELDTRNKKSKPVPIEDQKSFVGVIIQHKQPIIDTRSSYLYYFLNGFSAGDNSSNIHWIDLFPTDYGKIEKVKEGRVNAKEHDWAYHGSCNIEYISNIVNSKEFTRL